MTATGAMTTALPKEDVHQRVSTTLGMVFFIGSWSMAFGTIFLAFLILRQRVGVWPPEGIALPSFPIAIVATSILMASSVALRNATRALAAGREGYRRDWTLGLLLGLGFAALQGWLWLDLMAAGRGPSSGLYESLFYGLTWFHAAHVACGLVALLWASFGLATGRYGPHRYSTVGNVALFWHFVDVVWILLFLGFFVF
jgi:heme/copper-type cytochrome/quinol oxidase subunit 3